MTTEDFHDELSVLFEADDAELMASGEAFAMRVDRGIGRRHLLRRVVLTGATLIGGLVAGTQVPEVLMQMNAYGLEELPLFDGVAEQMQGQYMWYFIAGFAALVSTVTLLSQDRI